MKHHVAFQVERYGDADARLLYERTALFHFGPRGTPATLGADARRHFQLRDLIRWGAPLALLGADQLTLHAASARKNDATIAVMGPGGAGESTLARRLELRRWTMLSDDLIACDVDACVDGRSERVLRDWCVEAARDWREGAPIAYEALVRRLRSEAAAWTPLHAVLFLEQTRTSAARFDIRWLAPRETFELLTRHGFGKVPWPTAWAHQTQVHARLASTVAAAVVASPDGLERMADAVPALEHVVLTRIG